MKTAAIVPARMRFGEGPPSAPDFGDVYHPREGALQQARSVFLDGNGLPERWRGRERFTIIETGFGIGNNFLAAWAAWRDDPARCARLHFVSIEKHPPTREDLQRALEDSPLRDLAQQLVATWPPLTPNLHLLRFESGRVQLLLALGDAEQVARELVASADAFFLDGFAPARNAAMWSPALMKSLARLAAPGATAATWSAARSVREGLAAAGFEVQAAPGPGPKRDITLARYAPRFAPRRPPGRALPTHPPQHALIVGGGIAGAAAARALAAQGVACTVLDAHAEPGAQASGNPAGLFHGTVGRDDTPHTRWFRAASFEAAAWVRSTPQAGAADGLLRLNEEIDIDAMRALLDAQALPPAYLQALDAAQASSRAGLELRRPAWLFSAGGWADPRALIRAALALPGVSWRGNAAVSAIEPVADSWRLRDRTGRLIAEAPMVVLCNGADALGLAGLPSGWIERVRGQITWMRAAQSNLAPGVPGLPLASGSYVLALPGDDEARVVIGATQQPGDTDTRVRDADHRENLERAQRLLGQPVARADAPIEGRAGVRAVSRDRLPLAGYAPDSFAAPPLRRDAPRLVARQRGLFLLTALGSRGLTSAALAGELIAAQALGTPWPVEADLADALDPARCTLTLP